MQILAENLGKRFNKEWIFKGLNLDFQINHAYAVTGPNGSGKSTLLQVLSGMMPLSEGKITYSFISPDEDYKYLDMAAPYNSAIPPDDIYKYLSIAAPYLELIEEFTLTEQIAFHTKFKKLKNNISCEELIQIMQLDKSKDKEIRFFSSGMKMRLKLGLAFYSDSPILLLDEPTSNLDSKGIEWYQKEIKNNLKDRLVIICSNQKAEYECCEKIIDLGNRE
jgi:ABC-2 type transport system ATP-binding protein